MTERVRLRKHLATMTQEHNLKKNELNVVATFMGHNVAVHREYYRLPGNTLQLAKVGKLLGCVNEGIEMEPIDKERQNIKFSESENKFSGKDNDNELPEATHTMNDKKDVVKPAARESSDGEESSDGAAPLPPPFVKRKVCLKKPWSGQEISQLGSAFSLFMGVDYLPPKKNYRKSSREISIARGV